MDATAFLARVGELRRDGYRLVLINGTAVLDAGAIDLAWTFERRGALEHLRERVLPDDEVPSVSGTYPFAYLYENELRELFGVKVTGLSVDFAGQLYQTAVRVPMSPKAIRARLEAAKAKKS